jgi:hypothetical protein
MNIKYNVRRSGFLPPCKAAITKNLLKLNNGRTITLNFASGGYGGEIYVTIKPQNRATFSTNWNNTDPTRFPARIKAAATALRDKGFAGCFKIIHDDGMLEMQRI